MSTRTRTILTCAAAAAGLATSMAAPALATTRLTPSTVAGPRAALRLTHEDHAIGRSIAKVVNTRTFAGYAVGVATGSATTSEASFTVPALSCTTADRAILPDAGIGVGSNGSALAFVVTACVNGTATYFPGLFLNGKETDFQTTTFAVGDVLDVIAKVSTNRTRVQVTDVTTGVTQKIIGAGGRAHYAWIGDDAAGNSTGGIQHVPDFGKLTFKNCLIDGKALGSLRPQADQRVNSNGTVQISTGNFWPGGTAFTTHYQHS